MNLSVKENIIKEVMEEAGLKVKIEKVIAVQDREKHNLPVYAYKVCKIFIQCSVLGGSFKANNETTDSGYFFIGRIAASCCGEEQCRTDKNVFSGFFGTRLENNPGLGIRQVAALKLLGC